MLTGPLLPPASAMAASFGVTKIRSHVSRARPLALVVLLQPKRRNDSCRSQDQGCVSARWDRLQQGVGFAEEGVACRQCSKPGAQVLAGRE